MFIETVPNRNSPPAVLLRESFRDEHGKAQKRTVANLSKLPAFLIAGLKGLLKGGVVLGEGGEGLSIERSLPHGHVAAALGTIRKLALDRLMLSTAKDDASMRHRDLVVGLIVDRLVTPRSKLGFVRAINAETANSSIGALLDLGKVAEREVYEALDWLLAQQERVENGLARRHLKGGALVLYDVSSSYLEGRHCPLARYGYSRDHRGDRPQIVYGLLCTREGLPVAVEVFEGNTADPTTLTPQILKLKKRFGLERVVVVGDICANEVCRMGMLTSARIREDVKPAGLDWISCLRNSAVQALASDDGPLQMSLFDERDLAEISAPDLYPGERLIVCRNPFLAAERDRKRQALLEATEKRLQAVAAKLGALRTPLRGAANIALAVGEVINKSKVGKHFELTITDNSLSWRRKGESIEREAHLDGVYVVRTSLTSETMSVDEVVQSYKDLARVERSFRALKTVDLDIRPIRHWTPDRVRAHVFLCMLAYHVEWHLRQALAPLLFHDTDIETARAERASPVEKTEPSASAKAKKATKLNEDGLPVMAFGDLMEHLGTLARNTIAAGLQKGHTFVLHTKPTKLQDAAFKLLDIDPVRVQ
jgi:hypothetical protein